MKRPIGPFVGICIGRLVNVKRSLMYSVLVWE